MIHIEVELNEVINTLVSSGSIIIMLYMVNKIVNSLIRLMNACFVVNSMEIFSQELYRWKLNYDSVKFRTLANNRMVRDQAHRSPDETSGWFNCLKNAIASPLILNIASSINKYLQHTLITKLCDETFGCAPTPKTCEDILNQILIKDLKNTSQVNVPLKDLFQNQDLKRTSPNEPNEGTKKEEVNDEQVNDEQVNDEQVNGEQVNDEQVNDEQVKDNKMLVKKDTGVVKEQDDMWN